MVDATLLPASAIPGPVDPAALAAVSFLAAYPNEGTREAYRRDLRLFFEWCQQYELHPLRDVRRAHVQAFASHLTVVRNNSAATVVRRIGTLNGYYATAVLDELLDVSPCHHVKLPKVHDDPAKRTWLTRWELGAVMRAARDSKAPADWALITLLGTIGMRVGATCAIQVEDLSEDDQGYRSLYTVGKGGKPSIKILPIPTWRAIDRARGDRTSGPLLRRRDGSQMNRRSADVVVKRLCRAAGVTKEHISPHSLRRSFVTIARQAGVPLEVIQHDVDHTSMRTTQLYDQLGVEPHARACHTVAAAIASAS